MKKTTPFYFYESVTRLVLIIIIAASVFTAAPVFAGHTFAGVDLHLDFSASKVEPKEISLIRHDASKKATVLIFMSAKCPCSMSHAEEIGKLAKEFPDFRFIGINSNGDESIDLARLYFSSGPFSFPVLKDESGALADEFKAVKTPHAFILANDGRKLFQGGVSNSATFARADRRYLREALEDIQAGRDVRTPLARALGCAIPHGD